MLDRIVLHLSPIIPDCTYLFYIFKKRVGYNLNLESPKTFNEKLNWIKIYGRNPLYSVLADKYSVKQYVTEKIGSEYVVPCYGVWERFDDVEWNKLPKQFVLKCTHDSGGATVCSDIDSFNKEKIRYKFESALKKNYYWAEREWVYKDIKPRIIADKYLNDNTGRTLLDYKFWCFNGEPTYMYCTVKDKEVFENFYDMDFKPVEINHGFRRKMPEFEKPSNFEQMKELAKVLSQGIPFVRIDFFNVDNHIYFGEFTFYDWGGLRGFANKEQDYELGKLIHLPIDK